jgi:predicted SAM-dependent methyltransferase
MEEVKLNLGCGKQRIPGCIHIDCEASCEPDIVLDFINNPLPYETDSVDKIYFLHVIEHVVETSHFRLLEEFRRVLKPDTGKLIIAYPEFKTCALNYITNHKGQRDFFKNTIYGLQRYPSDFHVSLMDTVEFTKLLKDVGFKDIQPRPEKNEPYNTIVECVKGDPTTSYEEILNREIFGVTK